jgi:pimeloyl-ACP methyl ester carboxylesterase
LTLLFIHGAGASGKVWHLQLAHFRGSLALDLPGHPTGSGCTSIEDYADFVGKYIESNAVKDLVVVGHSMGGAIAIELALRGTRMAGLILVGTGARLRVQPEILRTILGNYDEACKLVARWSVSQEAGGFIVNQIAQEMLKVKAEVAHGDFSACDRFDRMNDVEKISAKTLIVCGADDRLTPFKYSQFLHERIRDSKLVVVPDAGHSVMLEKHREFNGALEAFLSSL